MSNRARPILLVEDDFVLRTALATFLTEVGYQVECAAHGLEAYHWLNSSPTKPAVIVLDMFMPYMNGVEFRDLQRALPSVADVPVIVITASGPLATEFADLDATQTFMKPLNTARFLAAIRELAPVAPV